MNTKKGENCGFGRGKAIMGIALAAILLASVFGAMVPTSARTSATDIVSGDTVYIGEQGINFPVTGFLEGVPDTNTEDASPIALSAGMTIPSTIKGKYFVDTDGTPGYSGADFYVFIDEATITGDVILNFATQDSVVGMTVPNSAEIVFKVQANIGDKIPGGKVDITVTDPDGVQVLSIDGQALSDIVILGSSMFIGDPAPTTTAPAYVDALDLNGMKLGTYMVTFKLDKSSCNLLDKSSATMEFTIRSEELSIEAAEDEVSLGEDIILRVTGNPFMYYYLIVTNVDSTRPPRIEFVGDVRALSGAAVISAAAPDLAAWIKTGSDGIADIKVATAGADTRTYTIKVYDAPGDAIGPLTPEIDWAQDGDIIYWEDDDDVDVTVVPATVIFDVPTTTIIGEEIEINGAISAGDQVDIIIRDEAIVATDEVVGWNNEFSVEWDTAGYVPGSYAIEAYIDFRPGESKNLSSYEGVDPDGSTTILLISPGVNATQPRNVVADGDDYTLEGTATGVNAVDYILVGPKGWKSGHDAIILGGILKGTASVTANEFIDDITMTEGLDRGIWVTVVLSPGRDGVYQTGEPAGALTLANLGVTAGKNQAQILEIIEDKITEAGSDDIMKTLSFKVEAPYVRFDAIENVPIGTPLGITGTTNRETGTMIVIYTIEGPLYLPAALAEVEWPTPDQGIFNATIDTTYAVAGNYTLRTDDGDWNTDTTTVEIRAAISVFDTGKGTYPSIAGMHNGTITPNQTITVSKLYTYPCSGTGGHTEYARIWNSTLNVTATWDGYQGDWHNISFNDTFVLYKNETYNFTITTGSYPQIHHTPALETANGWINCTEFVDANGNVHYDWIPAVRLE